MVHRNWMTPYTIQQNKMPVYEFVNFRKNFEDQKVENIPFDFIFEIQSFDAKWLCRLLLHFSPIFDPSNQMDFRHSDVYCTMRVDDVWTPPVDNLICWPTRKYISFEWPHHGIHNFPSNCIVKLPLGMSFCRIHNLSFNYTGMPAILCSCQHTPNTDFNYAINGQSAAIVVLIQANIIVVQVRAIMRDIVQCELDLIKR